MKDSTTEIFRIFQAFMHVSRAESGRDLERAFRQLKLKYEGFNHASLQRTKKRSIVLNFKTLSSCISNNLYTRQPVVISREI